MFSTELTLSFFSTDVFEFQFEVNQEKNLFRTINQIATFFKPYIHSGVACLPSLILNRINEIIINLIHTKSIGS